MKSSSINKELIEREKLLEEKRQKLDDEFNYFTIEKSLNNE
jgi:hypothetical protein